MRNRLNGRFWLLLLVAGSLNPLSAQTNAAETSADTVAKDTVAADTVAKDIERQLQEVVVTADSQYKIKDGTAYIPDKKAKKASSNGFNLLQRMAIAELNVDPLSNSVKTAANQPVALFIDYLPADRQQVDNLRTMEVQKVEVLDHPQDPRFNGEEHVVNYILVKYEYGGYTKASVTQGFNDYFGFYNLYSKLQVKKMVYDVAGNFYDEYSTHGGSDRRDLYRLPGGDITRQTETERSRSLSQNWYASLRGVYTTQQTVIQNTLNVNGSRSPYNDRTDLTRYLPPVFPDEPESTSRNSRSIGGSWTGYYRFFLPHGFSLNLKPGAIYGHNDSNSLFESEGLDLVSDVKEDVWSFSLDATLQKSLGRHALMFTAKGRYDRNDLDYAGSNPAEVNSRMAMYDADLEAYLNFGSFRLNASASLFGDRMSVNGKVTSMMQPNFYIFGNYNVGRRLTFRLYGKESIYGVPYSSMSPNIVMENRLFGISGNETLRFWRAYITSGDVSWRINGKCSLFAYVQWSDEVHPVVPVFYAREWNGSPVIVRSFANLGHKAAWQYGGSFSGRFLSNSLIVRAYVQGNSYSMKYDGLRTATRFMCSGYVGYMFGNMSVGLSGSTAERGMDQISEWKNRPSCDLNVGWSNGDWSVQAMWINFLTTSRKSRETWTDVPLYSSHEISYSGYTGNRVQLSLTYSFSYGKKISRDSNDEVGAVGGTQSAILK